MDIAITRAHHQAELIQEAHRQPHTPPVVNPATVLPAKAVIRHLRLVNMGVNQDMDNRTVSTVRRHSSMDSSMDSSTDSNMANSRARTNTANSTTNNQASNTMVHKLALEASLTEVPQEDTRAGHLADMDRAMASKVRLEDRGLLE